MSKQERTRLVIVGDSLVQDLESKEMTIYAYPGVSLRNVMKEPELYLSTLRLTDTLVLVFGSNDDPLELISLIQTLSTTVLKNHRDWYWVPPRFLRQQHLDDLDSKIPIAQFFHGDDNDLLLLAEDKLHCNQRGKQELLKFCQSLT